MATTAVKGPNARRRKAAEPVPVASGRFWIAAALVGAMIVIPFSPIANWFKPPDRDITDKSQWSVGNTTKVQITLVTADYNLLFCASDKVVDGAHCTYKTETEQWDSDPTKPVDDNKADIIQPYRTWPDNQLILVAGLWAEPNMALRLHREPSSGVAQQKLARFVAVCDVKFVGEIPNPKLRWNPGGPWQSEGGTALVARPISCTLGEE